MGYLMEMGESEYGTLVMGYYTNLSEMNTKDKKKIPLYLNLHTYMITIFKTVSGISCTFTATVGLVNNSQVKSVKATL